MAFFQQLGSGLIVQGYTAAVEEGEAFVVRYRIELDEDWHTRSAHVSSRTVTGFHELLIEADGEGNWEIDDKPVAALEGCLDLDLESSSLTNAFPVRRLAIAPGDAADAPAAYVRALDAGVERLDQRYVRLEDQNGNERYEYTAPAFEVQAQLVYDEAGLVLEYPGLAQRADG